MRTKPSKSAILYANQQDRPHLQTRESRLTFIFPQKNHFDTLISVAYTPPAPASPSGAARAAPRSDASSDGDASLAVALPLALPASLLPSPLPPPPPSPLPSLPSPLPSLPSLPSSLPSSSSRARAGAERGRIRVGRAVTLPACSPPSSPPPLGHRETAPCPPAAGGLG